MRRLQWTISHAVFVSEIDDQHREIFEALSDLADAAPSEARAAAARLTVRIADHFAHEERLMRAARYQSFRWHKRRHDAARHRVGDFVYRMESGDARAVGELVEYLTGWLHDHTRVADRMMGAALRNHQRCMWKLTLHASTAPVEGRAWVTADGEPFAPELEPEPKL